MENPIKMDDLGVPLFLETPIWVLQLAEQSALGWHLLKNSLDFTCLPIFTFISGRLAATCNLKNRENRTPRIGQRLKAVDAEVFYRMAQWKTELKWIP